MSVDFSLVIFHRIVWVCLALAALLGSERRGGGKGVEEGVLKRREIRFAIDSFLIEPRKKGLGGEGESERKELTTTVV